MKECSWVGELDYRESSFLPVAGWCSERFPYMAVANLSCCFRNLIDAQVPVPAQYVIPFSSQKIVQLRVVIRVCII